MHKPKMSPWYLGYSFQGAVILGIAPILLPVLTALSLGPAQVGMVVAAFYLGQMPAPVFGWLAEKTGRLGLFYLGGYVLIGLGLVFFPLVDGLWPWMALALLQGAGAGASNTVSAMYIVEYRPKDEWDERIGWLQTCNGTGQALGLVIAAVLQSDAGIGLYVAAGLMLPGLLLGRIGLPKRKEKAEGAAHRAHLRHHHRHPAVSVLHAMHAYQRPHLGALKGFVEKWRSSFGLMMLCWFLCLMAMWMVMNLYPLLFEKAYGIDAGLSSLYYGIFAGIGIFLYEPSGSWGVKFGTEKVLGVGLLALLLSLAGMSATPLLPQAWALWWAPLWFALLPIAWSPLIVAGTALAGQLTTVGTGGGLGVFNANTALSSVVGALLAGYVAKELDYAAIPMVAGVASVVGTVLYVPLLRLKKK